MKNFLNNNLSALNYKPEIDCLRAIAVFLVILFHLELLNVSGGFIGVDVFFVISGYLITNIIVKNSIDNKFSLTEFYIRRIRRIIPALYVTIFLTLVSGYFILSPDHFNRLGNSSISSTSALSNFFFWGEAGYFDFNKHFKPLLHTWSLSVELQFYLVWPILIYFIYKFFKDKTKIFVLLLILLSLLLSTLYSERATGYFYFTVFRLYEFAIGSFIYLSKYSLKNKYNDLFFIIGLLIIILSSFGFSEKSIFPGVNALIPCLGTSLILLTGGNLKYFRKLFINKFLIFSGKISYSLYLTHWPLIIFYKYMVLHPLSNLEKIILILVTIIISTFSYIFIELPFRKKTYNIYLISTRNVILSFILTFFSIILVSNYLISNDKYVKLNKEKQATINKLKKDDELFKNFEAKATDRIRNNIYFQNNKKKIKTLIWGDSHGGDLYRSLNINEEFSRLDVEFLSYDYFYCFKEKNFKDKIVQYIKDNIITLHSCEKKVQNFPYYDILTSSDIIILSSRWTEKIDFKKIVTFIRNYNSKNIIVFGRKPRFFHIPTLYIKSNNNLNYLAYVNRNKETSNINKEIKIKSEKNNLIFFDIENLVCHDDECIVSEENDLLISDEDHWSYRGSIYYGKKLIENNFLEIILENAK